MKSSTIILLYTSEKDPVASAMRAIEGIRVMHVDDLLEHLAPTEWPVVLGAKFPQSLCAEFESARVVNRIFTLEGTRTEETLRRWGVDERWLHIRMMDLLGRAAALSHDIGIRGVSRCLLPLNTQWFRVRKAAPDILTPSFAYGVGYEAPPDYDELTDPMQKSVWSIFDWREEQHMSESERQRNRFYVERPTGAPVVVHFYGDTHFWHFPRERFDVDPVRVQAIASTCREVFHSDCGEALLYRDNEGELRFYSFSPFMMSAALDERFGASIRSWTKQLESGHV
jgi:hypothetical protein